MVGDGRLVGEEEVGVYVRKGRLLNSVDAVEGETWQGNCVVGTCELQKRRRQVIFQERDSGVHGFRG